MSKVSGFATLVAVAFSWFAVSCAAPTGAAKAPAGTPILASATVPGASATGAATTPVAFVSAATSSPFLLSLLAFVGLGVSMFVLRGKPQME